MSEEEAIPYSVHCVTDDHTAVIAEFRQILPEGKNIDTNKVCSFDLTLQIVYFIDQVGLSKYTDYDCLRFLRGCNGDSEKALAKLQAYHDWFHKLMDPISPLNGLHFSPNTLLYTPEHLANHPTGQGLLPVSHSGFDREGRALYWEKTGAVQANFNVVK